MMSTLTGRDNYFEDFQVGDIMRHARGKTVEPLENVLITNMAMNSAAGHFDEHAMRGTPFGRRVTFGGVTAALVIGMAAQDTAENALAELGLTRMRLKSPVFHGDTLYAFSEVLRTDPAEHDDAGIVTFKHWGFNDEEILVFEAERRVLIKRRSAWVGR